MSIEQLKTDLKSVIEAIPAMGSDLPDYLRNNLLPLFEAVVAELGEQDEAIADLVQGASEVLHTESAGVFAAIIVSGRALAAELRTRAGNDHRLLALVKEFGELADQGEEILNDIVIPDVDEDEDPDEPAPAAGNGAGVA